MVLSLLAHNLLFKTRDRSSAGLEAPAQHEEALEEAKEGSPYKLPLKRGPCG